MGVFNINKNIIIFCGHFGSGKTEVALNYILNKSHEKNKVIIDLDIVNPFFRAADAEKILEEKNIRLVKPLFANTNVEVPALTGEIDSSILNEDIFLVIDVGGDDTGSKVLARYREEIVNRGYKMYCVVNIYRLFTQNSENIIKMVNEIQKSSKLEVDGIINNTNLLKNTTEQDILKGQNIVEKVSLNLKKPIFLTTFMNSVDISSNIVKNEVMKMEKYIKTPIE
jgi:predicted ATPase